MELKQALLKFGNIDSIYHFRHSGFPDAAVGATIINFQRTTLPNNEISIYRYDNAHAIDLNKCKTETVSKQISRVDFLDFRSNENSVIKFSSDFLQK